jgi:SAM-dependent methyltransferase
MFDQTQIRTVARGLRRARVVREFKRWRHRGNRVYCPCCRSQLADLAYAYGEDRVCWVCGSMERHRLLHVLFDERPAMFTPGMALLHVAPEAPLLQRIQSVAGIRYVGGDLERHFSDVRLDVTDLAFPDASFDAVICNHVLEHITDDHRAMSEIRRVLKPDGWALLLVPDVVEQGPRTYEDRRIVEPAARLQAYGQVDHVRVYGWDYVDRLSAAGLDTEVIRMEDHLSSEFIQRHRLEKFGSVEPIFLARPST